MFLRRKRPDILLHKLIDDLLTIETLEEMKVILYVLQHEGEEILLPGELEKQTGLSRQQSRDGLKQAQNNGYIILAVSDEGSAT